MVTRFYVILAFLIVTAMFCLGVVVAKANEPIKFKCTTMSEYQYRQSMPKNTEIKVISGKAVTRMVSAINMARLSKDLPVFNAQRALVAYLSGLKIRLSLFDNGCQLDWSDTPLDAPDAVNMMIYMGLEPQDLKSDLGV
jgi:hypothetical protein